MNLFFLNKREYTQHQFKKVFRENYLLTDLPLYTEISLVLALDLIISYIQRVRANKEIMLHLECNIILMIYTGSFMDRH